ncbi:unnamed protein product [Closterium sp. NIES-64]|nr:unnamed protein product [Closterium sp. NIES-64]
MILVSEIGDETFIIAALMAMRHPRSIVLAGALSALGIMTVPMCGMVEMSLVITWPYSIVLSTGLGLIMPNHPVSCFRPPAPCRSRLPAIHNTVLSTGLGLIVPNLISRKATNSAATVLYTFFGLRLLYIAWRADPKESAAKEMEEVEEKLESEENDKGRHRGIRKFFAGFCTPVFLEAFILTFLAEWGDRSQIATIAVSLVGEDRVSSADQPPLAAHKDAFGVTVGATVGHVLAAHKNALGVTVGATLGHVVCTTIAVVGGRLLALRISQRTVAMMGGALFLIFAVHSYYSPIE